MQKKKRIESEVTLGGDMLMGQGVVGQGQGWKKIGIAQMESWVKKGGG